MERRTAMKLMGATAAMAGAGLLSGRANAADKVTIALIPGLLADGFYITMHKGADAAAKAIGADLTFQGPASGTSRFRCRLSTRSSRESRRRSWSRRSTRPSSSSR